MLMKGLLYGLSPILVVLVTLMLLQKLAFKQVVDVFGFRFVVLTGVLGTSLHEVSHAIMCLIFRHKITDMKLFKPDSDGTLGYVNFSYNPISLYQRMGLFFVGMAPFFMAVVYFYVATLLILDVNLFASSEWVEDFSSVKYQLLNFVIEVFQSGLRGVVWAFSMLAVVLHMMPSKQDLKGAKTGSTVLIAIYLLCATFVYVLTGGVERLHDQIFSLALMSMLYLAKLMITFSFFLLFIVFVCKMMKLILRK